MRRGSVVVGSSSMPMALVGRSATATVSLVVIVVVASQQSASFSLSPTSSPGRPISAPAGSGRQFFVAGLQMIWLLALMLPMADARALRLLRLDLMRRLISHRSFLGFAEAGPVATRRRRVLVVGLTVSAGTGAK